MTEQSVNGADASLAISDVVIVCDKLDTGYNEPLLACMFIDRMLRSSYQTVQLLSRLNRLHPRTFGSNYLATGQPHSPTLHIFSGKPFTRIIDFANHAANIRRNFADYWEAARSPVNADDVNIESAAMNLASAGILLCDMLPQLAQTDRVDVEALAQNCVLPLERDAFQQVVDAARTVIDASKTMENLSGSHPAELIMPLRYNNVDTTCLFSEY